MPAVQVFSPLPVLPSVRAMHTCVSARHGCRPSPGVAIVPPRGCRVRPFADECKRRVAQRHSAMPGNTSNTYASALGCCASNRPPVASRLSPVVPETRRAFSQSCSASLYVSRSCRKVESRLDNFKDSRHMSHLPEYKFQETARLSTCLAWDRTLHPMRIVHDSSIVLLTLRPAVCITGGSRGGRLLRVRDSDLWTRQRHANTFAAKARSELVLKISSNEGTLLRVTSSQCSLTQGSSRQHGKKGFGFWAAGRPNDRSLKPRNSRRLPTQEIPSPFEP